MNRQVSIPSVLDLNGTVDLQSGDLNHQCFFAGKGVERGLGQVEVWAEVTGELTRDYLGVHCITGEGLVRILAGSQNILQMRLEFTTPIVPGKGPPFAFSGTVVVVRGRGEFSGIQGGGIIVGHDYRNGIISFHIDGSLRN